MVDETEQTYVGVECDHENTITFVGRSEWSAKTKGCDSCGRTNKFVKKGEVDQYVEDENMVIQHGNSSDIKPEGQDDDQTQTIESEVEDSDSVEKTETDTQESGEDENINEQVNEVYQNGETDTEHIVEDGDPKPVGHALPEDYRDLQGVAGQFDIKKNQKREELHNQIVEQYDDDPEKYAEIVWEDEE